MAAWTLTEDQWEALDKVRIGTTDATVFRNATIILMSAVGRPKFSIAHDWGSCPATVDNIRKQYRQRGLARLQCRKPPGQRVRSGPYRHPGRAFVPPGHVNANSTINPACVSQRLSSAKPTPSGARKTATRERRVQREPKGQAWGPSKEELPRRRRDGEGAGPMEKARHARLEVN
jgi:hypothetical protein